jgi:hypothetical protein
MVKRWKEEFASSTCKVLLLSALCLSLPLSKKKHLKERAVARILNQSAAWSSGMIPL